MKSVGFWILGAAVGCFAAGMNVGLVAPGLVDACRAKPPALDEDYIAKLVADYKLTAAQERTIRFVLERCVAEENAAYRLADPSTLPPAVQKGLLEARGRAEKRIMAVLDAEQRARYDSESRPK